MDSIVSLTAAALVLGATSGLSPGPLLTLVISESFQRGFRSGAAVSMAPFITDGPIILLMIVLADALSFTEKAIDWLYLLGAFYLVYLSVEVFRFKGMEIETVSEVRTSLIKGALVNLLNPAPYVFWLTVGVPLIFQAREISWAVVCIFLGVFYGMLVGLKMLLAALVGENRHLLKGSSYIVIMRVLGLLLLFFAAVFIKSGVEKIF